jgi:hypothetical protein
VDLVSLFAALHPPAGDLLPAVAMPGRTRDFLAKSDVGRPLLLLAQDTARAGAPPIRLRNLSVQFDTVCRVSPDNSPPIEKHFVVVSCDADDASLYRFFLTAAETILRDLPEPACGDDVRTWVSGFVELFRLLITPSSRSVAGVWAELFVILVSSNPTAWVDAWHTKASDKHDFSFGDVKFEVKSTRSPVRVHEFSLEQVSVPRGAVGTIISLILRTDAGGDSLIELAEEVSRRVAAHPSASLKVWSNVAEVIGTDFGLVDELRFDRRHAEQTLRAIPQDAIPRPRVDDPRVMHVRFSADLSAIAEQGERLPAALMIPI